MSPHLHKEQLLNSSGCLSLSALERYRDKELTSEEKAEAERHLSACQFCRDALEGLTMLPAGSSSRQGIRELNSRLRRRHGYIPAGMKRQKSLRLNQIIIPAAASIILLAGIIGYFNYFLPENQELAIAETEEVIPSTPAHKESQNQQLNASAEKDHHDVITEENIPIESRDVDKVEEASEAQEEGLSGVLAEEEIQSGAGGLDDDEIGTIIVVEDDSTIEAAIYGSGEDKEIMADINISLEEPSISAIDNEAIMLEEVGTPESDQRMSQSKSQAKRRSDGETQDTTYAMAIVEEMPEYPGGMDSLHTYLQSNMSYPRDTNMIVQGTVWVSFIINENGTVSDILIKRGLGEEFDQVVIKAIEGMPAWKPGKNMGKNVPVAYVLPIRFSLK